MSWCGCICDTVETAVDLAIDFAEDMIDDVTDVVEEACEIVGEALEDSIDWVSETAEDLSELVTTTATAIWGWVTETGESIWEWIKQKAGDVWEWTTGALEDAWDWVSETAVDAWDWVSSTAETIWDALVILTENIDQLVEEKVIPFLLDAFWLLGNIDEIVFAGLGGLYCLLTGQDEKEYNVIEGMFLLDEEILASRRVAFLPVTDKYVIFSDHHLFIAGDSLDRFRQLRNHELYQAILATYATAGYMLIENGDIEDLWMKDTTLGGIIRERITDALGWPLGTIIEEEYEDYRVRSQAVKIFDNNADIYQTVRALFYDQDHYIRLVGNHDDYWSSEDYLPGLQVIYPNLNVYDYVFLGDYDEQNQHNNKSPEIIIAHGHQIDAWNNAACRDAGATLTEFASGIPSLAAGIVERSEWEPKIDNQMLENELAGGAVMDEPEFHQIISSTFNNYPYIPEFIFGHTHHALIDPYVPESIVQWFDEYTNSGTAGRWEEFIWCVTVENGRVGLHGWTWEGNKHDKKPQKYTFGGHYADYLQVSIA